MENGLTERPNHIALSRYSEFDERTPVAPCMEEEAGNILPADLMPLANKSRQYHYICPVLNYH